MEYGVGLYGATGASVLSNTANGDGDGVYVGGPGSVTAASTGNTISQNTTESNAIDGIVATTTGTGNTFASNSSAGNADWDCLDGSTGGGTEETANRCSQDSRDAFFSRGLCPRTVVGSAPVITSKNAATATKGTPFSFTVTAFGLPPPVISYSPYLKWLTLKDNGGGIATLSAKRPKVGVHVITISAGNSAGATSQTFTLTVNR